MIRRHGNVHVKGFADGLAVVHGFHHGQMFLVGVNDVGYAQQQVGALDGVDLFPALPGDCGGLDGAVHVFPGGFGADGQAFTVGRTEGFKGAAVRGGAPFAVNVEAVLGEQLRFLHLLLLYYNDVYKM